MGTQAEDREAKAPKRIREDKEETPKTEPIAKEPIRETETRELSGKEIHIPAAGLWGTPRENTTSKGLPALGLNFGKEREDPGGPPLLRAFTAIEILNRIQEDRGEIRLLPGEQEPTPVLKETKEGAPRAVGLRKEPIEEAEK